MFCVVAAGFVALFLSLAKKKSQWFLQRGMNLALFLVSVPQIQPKETEKEIPLEVVLKAAEQFYYNLAAIREKKKFFKWLVGNPFLVFEIAVDRLSEEICFYFACPHSLAGLLEKQILGFWPKASVQRIKDYNIFNPSGKSVGSMAILERPGVLPLKTYQELRIDPISPITSVLTKLAKEGEGASVQVIVRPRGKGLAKRATKLMENMQKGARIEKGVAGFEFYDLGKTAEMLGWQKKDKNPQEEMKRPEITAVQQEQMAAIGKKAAQPVFDVNLRLVASAGDEARAQTILKELESSFEQFNTVNLNSLKFKNFKGSALRKLFYQYSFRVFDDRKTMLLSAAELTGLFHFPLSEIGTPHLKWLKAKQAPPPNNLPQTGLLIGRSVFRGDERLVRMMPNDRGRHLYIIGQTGTGKSAFMRELIRQDMEQDQGLCFIDPHGDSAEILLGLVPKERAEDLIYFNPTDPQKAIGLNMLEYNPQYPETKTFVVNELLEIFEKLYNLQQHGFGGPVFEQYMRNSLLLVMEHPESGNTLIEVPRVLSDTGFRRFKLQRCRNIVVKNFWELEAEKAGGEASLANMVPYITSKMNIFIANDMMRPIIAQQKSAFDFRTIMDEGKILIVNLSKGQLGDMNSFLLGMIIVGKLLMGALSRADVPESRRRDFHVYIDEFHNVTTKTVATGLAEARKYHLNLVLAHQFIGQLDEQTQKAIFGNVGSMLSFRVGPDDAKYLITQFGPVFDENDLVNLDNYNAAIRLLINGETSRPFNIMTMPPKKDDEQAAGLMKELSRIKFGKDRQVVEKELAERLRKEF
ncbi:MAG: type IV secretion system DNA-binding domain-containing protein [Patescibacteria group bacterium]|nr:type IV secretion system DNA-binding domain-containing protein [Patescibacteria group bacterium]